LWAQQAYAGGRFVQNGDAQTSTYLVRGVTTDSAPRELFLDQVARRLSVPFGSTWTFEILVTARSSTGASAGYKLCGVIENNSAAGGCFLIGPVDLAFEREERPAWSVVVEANDAADALIIRVIGESAMTIRWVACVRTTEVIY
jgi:hypothetical protein